MTKSYENPTILSEIQALKRARAAGYGAKLVKYLLQNTDDLFGGVFRPKRGAKDEMDLSRFGIEQLPPNGFDLVVPHPKELGEDLIGMSQYTEDELFDVPSQQQ